MLKTEFFVFLQSYPANPMRRQTRRGAGCCFF
jgi:hypothetical protein